MVGNVLSGVPRTSLAPHKAARVVGSGIEPREGGLLPLFLNLKGWRPFLFVVDVKLTSGEPPLSLCVCVGYACV